MANNGISFHIHNASELLENHGEMTRKLRYCQKSYLTHKTHTMITQTICVKSVERERSPLCLIIDIQ